MKDILADLRMRAGLKQADVAKRINVNTSAISKYEQGKNYPEYDTLLRLADLYNVSLDYLFGRTKIKASLHALESSLITEEGNIPIDFIFELNREDKELIRRLLVSLSEKPQYSSKSKK